MTAPLSGVVSEAGTPHARYAVVDNDTGQWKVAFREVTYYWSTQRVLRRATAARTSPELCAPAAFDLLDNGQRWAGPSISPEQFRREQRTHKRATVSTGTGFPSASANELADATDALAGSLPREEMSVAEVAKGRAAPPAPGPASADRAPRRP